METIPKPKRQPNRLPSRGMSQKMLHGAMAELNAADADARERAMQTVERLFLRDGSAPR